MPIDMDLVNQIKAQRSPDSSNMETAPSIDMELVNQIKNEKPAVESSSFMDPSLGSINATAQSINNVYEQTGRGLQDKLLRAGAAVGLLEENAALSKRDNLKKIYDAAARDQAQREEQYPVASTVGNVVGTAGILAPTMPVGGGAGVLGRAAVDAASMGALTGAQEMGSNADVAKQASIGAGLGALGSLAGSAIGAGISKAYNAAKGAWSAEAQGAMKAGEQLKTPVRLADVAPNWAKSVFDNTSDIPFGGSAKAFGQRTTDVNNYIDDVLKTSISNMKNKPYANDLVSLIKTAADPNGANNFEAQALLKSLQADDNWAQIVSNSGRLKDYQVKAAYTQAKNNIVEQADKLSGINLAEVENAINKNVANILKPGTNETRLGYTNTTIKDINSIRDEIGFLKQQYGDSVPFSAVEKLQQNVQGLVNDIAKSANTGSRGGAELSLFQDIKKGIDNTQMAHLNKEAPDLWNQLRDLKSSKKIQIDKYENSALARALEKSANPRDTYLTVMRQAGRAQDMSKNLYDMLDDKGRNAFKAGYLNDIFSRTRSDDVFSDYLGNVTDITGKRISNRLTQSNAILNQFFNKEEQQVIKGAAQAMEHLNGYKNLFQRNPNGQMQANLTKLVGLVGGGGFAAPLLGPAAAAVPITAATIFNRAMNSTVFTKFAAAASGLQPGTPAYISAMDHLGKLMIKATVLQAANDNEPANPGA
jgi:hypothetical protein